MQFKTLIIRLYDKMAITINWANAIYIVNFLLETSSTTTESSIETTTVLVSILPDETVITTQKPEGIHST